VELVVELVVLFVVELAATTILPCKSPRVSWAKPGAAKRTRRQVARRANLRAFEEVDFM
jgi:hypothetical protein